MIDKVFCEGFAAVLLGLGALSLSDAAELRGIHLSTSASSAQVTLDISEGATHKLFTLEHPDRVVIDLPQTRLASEVRVPAASGVVTDVRVGSQPDGTLRVVVQLRSALAAHSVWAPGEEGGQLVLSLGEPAQELAAAPPKTARAAHADMFISVHADSMADRSITGASVYVLSVHGASSEAARWLAERENTADLVGGVRADDQGALEPVLIEEAQNQIIGVSASAAERVVSALEGVGEIRKAQVQRAGFVVLKSRAIPSMLIETAYISNPAEERRLRSAREQARLADAIAGGVRSYFTLNPPDGTRFK